jgi:hypothetical protein
MKTTILILLFSIAIVITACTTSQTSTTEVAVFRDITDQFTLHPKADDILGLYDFDKSKWNGGIFHFSDITQVSLNISEETKLQSENQWLSNEFQREERIKLFQKSITDILTNAEQTPVGKNNSSVYFPIATELNRLAQSKSEKKYLLIYSDLMENTADVSFYNKNTIEQIKTDPEAVRKQFEQLQALLNLNGIRIYFIYQPIDTESDKAFTIVSGFYKKLLEDKGATVTISANINI